MADEVDFILLEMEGNKFNFLKYCIDQSVTIYVYYLPSKIQMVFF